MTADILMHQISQIIKRQKRDLKRFQARKQKLLVAWNESMFTPQSRRVAK